VIPISRKVKLEVGTHIKFRKECFPSWMHEEIRSFYSHTFTDKVVRWVASKKIIENQQVKVSTLAETKTHFIAPRGSLHKLERILQVRRYTPQLRFHLTDISLPFPVELKLSLYEYQVRAEEKLLKFFEGNLEAPCGSGKTVIALGIISHLKQTTLILVHTTVIFQQWKKHLEDNLGVENVGIIGGGEKRPRPITLGMVQTLHKLSNKSMANLAKVFGCVICDEAHHVPAYTFLKIIARLKPKYLYGLTATPERKDGKEFLLYDFIGPNRYTISDSELIASGRITDVEVKWANTNSQIIGDEWHYMMSALISTPSRNRIILSEIIEASKNGHYILVLSERVDHCHWISQMLTNKGYENLCITGKTVKSMGVILKKAKDFNILVATMAIAKEGLDLPEISCVMIMTPTNNKQVLKQMIGRGRRFKKHKTLVVDFYDSSCLVFSRIANNRMKWYHEWNFDQMIPDSIDHKPLMKNPRLSSYRKKRK